MPHPVVKYVQNSQQNQKQLRRETYQDRGRTVGALAGAGLGAAAVGNLHLKMASKGRRLKPGMGKQLAGFYAAGSGVGALGGALVGETAGTFVARKKPTRKGEEKLFQTMNPTTKARLVSLNAKLSRSVEFVAQNEEDHTVRNTAIAAGGLAAAYGAGSYLRGRKSRVGPQLPGVKGVVNDAMSGHGMNVSDMKAGVANAGAAAVAAKRATVEPLARAGQTAANAGRSVSRTATGAVQGMKQAANQGVATLRRKFGKGDISRMPLVLAK